MLPRKGRRLVSNAELLLTTIVDLFHTLHGQLREEIRDLDTDALNWTPGPETNSIGTLIVHILGTEEEVLRSVRGLLSDRVRAAEFAPRVYTRADLVQRMQAADTGLDELARGISADDLQALRKRTVRPDAAPGMFWLLRSYGHSREHLAHLQLTRQLYSLAHSTDDASST
jgi:hypothetical protein